MTIAWVLLLIVGGSVLFHVFNPWWVTPLASNWKTMDDTLTITVVITAPRLDRRARSVLRSRPSLRRASPPGP